MSCDTWNDLAARGARWKADPDIHHELETGREIQAEFRLLADERSCSFVEDRCEWIADPIVNDVWGAAAEDGTIMAVYYRRDADFEMSAAFDRAVVG